MSKAQNYIKKVFWSHFFSINMRVEFETSLTDILIRDNLRFKYNVLIKFKRQIEPFQNALREKQDCPYIRAKP